VKTVLVITAVLALVGPVLAWVYVDGPTALLFLAASVVICACAAMPVVFSVGTRRNDLARLAREEAEEIAVDGRKREGESGAGGEEAGRNSPAS
jgi:hypothetical protein